MVTGVFSLHSATWLNSLGAGVFPEIRRLLFFDFLQIMSLLDTLKADLLAARKEKNTMVVATLSTLLGDLETNSKKTGKPIDDSQITALAKNRISTLRDVISQLNGERNIAVLETEIPLYKKYIPAQLTDDQIKLMIDLLHGEYENLQIGTVQAYFRTNYLGLYDAKRVTEIFKGTPA